MVRMPQGLVLILLYVYHTCMVMTFSKRKNLPDKVANPSRGQLNRELYSLSTRAFVPTVLV